ncbi:hypothetical protein CcaverHIS002_0103160 [Cutaneotrichosporon cavernicola]|nr:hypothetical protein CcaverHIS002_0103160 [Cutaneotrichosporon cavernicola]
MGLEVSTPSTLNGSLNTCISKIKERGTPVNLATDSSLLTLRVLSDMNDSNSDFGIMTNCNTFVAVRKTIGGASTVFNFSPSIEGSGSPFNSNLCQSPFGLLMGIAVSALSERGVKVMSGRSPTTSAVLKHVLNGLHHFDPLRVSRSISYPKEHNRHSNHSPQTSSYVCQLGPAVFSLGFPQGHSYEELWPATFYGDFIVEPGELFLSLLDRHCDDFAWIPTLQVVDLVAQGYTWNVWTACVPWAYPSKPDVVIRWGRVRPSNLRRIAEEGEILRGELRPLEGLVVPRFYGLFGSVQPKDDEQWCMLFDFAGQVPTDEERSSKNLHGQIRRQYERLHKAGIVHNKVEWHHILVLDSRPASSRVWLVDFAKARTQKSMRQAEWEDLCEREMAEVETLFLAHRRSSHCLIE